MKYYVTLYLLLTDYIITILSTNISEEIVETNNFIWKIYYTINIENIETILTIIVIIKIISLFLLFKIKKVDYYPNILINIFYIL